MMTSDTTDATLALKGILGIGGVVKQSESTKTKAQGNTTKVEGDSEISKVDVKKNPNGKKKKKKKVENKSGNTVQKVKKPKSKVQSNGQQQGSKKGNKKKPPKETSKEQNTKDENFAWSAFQSPPDASALPLPAFGSSFSFENEDKVQALDPATNREEVAASSPVGDQNEGGECGINLNNLSTEKRTENEIKAILNISHNEENSKTTEEEKTVERNDSNAQSSICNSSGGSKTDNIRTEQESNNGVNLASLTISTSSEDKSTPTKEKSFSNDARKLQTRPDSIDPIAMLMNAQSYGTANPTISNHYHSYNMYSQNTSPHPQLHSPHHQIVPPFLTIQVQVPMHLLPGRRMIVPGSPLTGGYPIPVVVPDGVCPGMYIPVSIPNPASGGSTLQRH